MNEIIKKIESQLMNLYPTITIHDWKCFILPNGVIVHIDSFDQSIVAEYADNSKQANVYDFEDGNRFYLEDGETRCINRLIDEIKSEGQTASTNK